MATNVVSKDLAAILHNIEISQIAMGDWFYDLQDPRAKRKIRFWDGAEKIITKAMDEIAELHIQVYGEEVKL